MIYDLHNDELERSFEIPDDQMVIDSFFANIAVEDEDCEVSITGNLQNNESNNIRHI